MNENEAYMIPECNLYRTKTFSQEVNPSTEIDLREEVRNEMAVQPKFDSAH